MKKIFVLLSLISLLFLASSCPKNPDNPTNQQLPPATQTGANTFGCFVNGKVWLPTWGSNGPPMQAQYYRGSFFLVATNHENGQTFDWVHDRIYNPGTYYFKSAPSGGAPGGGFWNYNGCFYNSNDADSLNTYVTITKLDSVNSIISGTFNLLFLPTGIKCDTVRITSGRFDAKYTN